MQSAVVLSFAAVVIWLAAVAVVDQRTGRIPNRLIVPAVAGTAVVAVMIPAVGVSACVLAVPYAVAFVAGAVGGGDVKLALPCGGLLADPASCLVAAVFAALGTVVVCGVAKRSRHPHGPVLVLSTLAVMIL